jgi:hypothetical protein
MEAIDATFEKLAKVLLVNGLDNVDNANDTNTHGKKKDEWQQVILKFKSTRGISGADGGTINPN